MTIAAKSRPAHTLPYTPNPAARNRSPCSQTLNGAAAFLDGHTLGSFTRPQHAKQRARHRPRPPQPRGVACARSAAPPPAASSTRWRPPLQTSSMYAKTVLAQLRQLKAGDLASAATSTDVGSDAPVGRHSVDRRRRAPPREEAARAARVRARVPQYRAKWAARTRLQSFRSPKISSSAPLPVHTRKRPSYPKHSRKIQATERSTSPAHDERTKMTKTKTTPQAAVLAERGQD